MYPKHWLNYLARTEQNAAHIWVYWKCFLHFKTQGINRKRNIFKDETASKITEYHGVWPTEGSRGHTFKWERQACFPNPASHNTVLNITAVTCPESFSGRENNTTLKKLHFVLFVFILQREDCGLCKSYSASLTVHQPHSAFQDTTRDKCFCTWP